MLAGGARQGREPARAHPPSQGAPEGAPPTPPFFLRGHDGGAHRRTRPSERGRPLADGAREGGLLSSPELSDTKVYEP